MIVIMKVGLKFKGNKHEYLLAAIIILLSTSKTIVQNRDYPHFFCGSSFLDGSLDEIFAERSQNLKNVSTSETLILSFIMIAYVLNHLKPLQTK